jgi:Protein of unknown function (DUF2975)
MAATAAARLSTIQRASRALRRFFIFLAALLVLGTLATIANAPPNGISVLAGIVFQGTSMTGKIEALLLVQKLLGTALSLKVLYHLVRLMGLFAEGKLFTALHVAQIRQVGLTLMCAPLVWLIGLVGAAPEIAAAQDQWVRIMPSFPGGPLINGAALVFAAWIMNEARGLRDEQNLVI